MDQKFVVVTDNVFSTPMSKDEAIKSVKEHDKNGVTAYIISEKEAKRVKTPDNFNKPKWS